jgi:hypothetical protein
MTIELTTEQLAQELERRQQQEAQDQQHQAATIEAAQEEWSRELLKTYKAREEELEEDGRASMEAGEKAAQAGDLAGAFIGYTGWHAARMGRYYLRLAAQSAVNRVPDYTGPHISDLRLVDVAFSEWLNDQAAKLSAHNGADKYEATLGAEIPTNYEEATAWLNAQQ